MTNIVKLVDGKLVYEGILSSQEIASIDEILNTLRIEIPEVEAELSKEYGSSVLYKYYLGKFLATLLEKYSITSIEQRKFWDEIKDLASQENRTRDEGKNAVTRSFYQQCYLLSQHSLELVNKLSWRQWQSLLDRVSIREDPRIYDWILTLETKIREDDWREFQKGLNMYLKNKDTSVFEMNELSMIYDSILLMARYWRENFSKSVLKDSGTIKQTPGALAKRFYALCFEKKKTKKSLVVTEEICNEAFREILF